MDKQEILNRVLTFCDVRGDAFYWRDEPTRSELFRIFHDSHCAASVTPDEIRAYVRHRMEPAARWNIPMQERVNDICTAWDEWEYAVGSFIEASAVGTAR